MILLGEEAFNKLKKYKIPIAEYGIISTKEQLKELKIPCVLKAISPSIIHKTEAGAIEIAYKRDDLFWKYDIIRELGKVLYQPFIEGDQIIIGIKHDETFGPVIMCGAGGIYTEVYKDVAFRVCPITSKDAEDMIKELKFYKVLQGFRGKKANLKVLINALVNVSKFAMKEKVKELDINPFIINEKGGKVVDTRIIF